MSSKLALYLGGALIGGSIGYMVASYFVSKMENQDQFEGEFISVQELCPGRTEETSPKNSTTNQSESAVGRTNYQEYFSSEEDEKIHVALAHLLPDEEEEMDQSEENQDADESAEPESPISVITEREYTVNRDVFARVRCVYNLEVNTLVNAATNQIISRRPEKILGEDFERMFYENMDERTQGAADVIHIRNKNLKGLYRVQVIEPEEPVETKSRERPDRGKTLAPDEAMDDTED